MAESKKKVTKKKVSKKPKCDHKPSPPGIRQQCRICGEIY